MPSAMTGTNNPPKPKPQPTPDPFVTEVIEEGEIRPGGK
jgi:hypothetical protein